MLVSTLYGAVASWSLNCRKRALFMKSSYFVVYLLDLSVFLLFKIHVLGCSTICFGCLFVFSLAVLYKCSLILMWYASFLFPLVGIILWFRVGSLHSIGSKGWTFRSGTSVLGYLQIWLGLPWKLMSMTWKRGLSTSLISLSSIMDGGIWCIITVPLWTGELNHRLCMDNREKEEQR